MAGLDVGWPSLCTSAGFLWALPVVLLSSELFCVPLCAFLKNMILGLTKGSVMTGDPYEGKCDDRTSKKGLPLAGADFCNLSTWMSTSNGTILGP